MTMPAVFQQLPFGQGLAVVFFSLLLVVAALSSISLLEHFAVLPVREPGLVPPRGVQPSHCPGDGGGIPVDLSFGPWAHPDPVWQEHLRLLDFITST